MRAGKDIGSALICKKCTSSKRKLRDRARKLIELTLTAKTPSISGYVSSSALAGNEDFQNSRC